MKDLEKKVLEKIKKEKIKPKSRMYFIAKRLAIWAFIFLTLFVSSFAMAVLFEIFFESDSGFAKLLAGSYLAYFLALAGLFWLGLFVLSLVLLFVEYRNTKYGYRKNAGVVLVIAILASFVFAFALWEEGLDDNMQKFTRKIVPLISTQKARESMWHKPDKGLFVLIPLEDFEEDEYEEHEEYEEGEEYEDEFEHIEEFSPKYFTEKIINAIGLDGKSYIIDISGLSEKDITILKNASRVIVAGVLKESGIVQACAVRVSPGLSKIKKDKIHRLLRQKGLTNAHKNGVFSELLKQIETNKENSRIYKCK